MTPGSWPWQVAATLLRMFSSLKLSARPRWSRSPGPAETRPPRKGIFCWGTKLGFASFKASLGRCFLVFWFTKIDPGEEGPGELQEGAAGRLQHPSAPGDGSAGCLSSCTFSKILLVSQFSRWRCCSSSWDISAARPGRRGVDKTELLRTGRQLGSLVVRSWQPELCF